MKKTQPASEIFWDLVPEIDQHEVRYTEYTLKSPKTFKVPEKRQLLTKSIVPIIDCEIDDESDVPDYSSYTLSGHNIETINEEEKKTEKKKFKKKDDLSLDSIYDTLREMKLSTIHKIIVNNKDEFIKIKQNPPSKKYLCIATQFLKTMFNPNQKLKINMFIREALDIPPHVFQEVQYILTLLVPEAAIMIFQKKYKIDTRINAVGLLSKLEISDSTFYEKKAKKDLHCRT